MSNILKEFIEGENRIFNECQSVDYLDFIKDREKALRGNFCSKDWIDIVKNTKRNIGIYAGSFNPFHMGHLNVLTQAERVFDKVILAKGINPGKSNKQYEFPSAVSNRQLMSYEGLLTDFIDSLGYEVTLIRGLRGSSDLESETTQLRFLQDLKPDIKVVSFTCDSQFEHISSTACRALERYNKQGKYVV